MKSAKNYKRKPENYFFALRLKELRAEKGLSQSQLGLIADLAQYTISDYEQGHSLPGYLVLGRIAQAMDVPVCALFGPSCNSTQTVP